MADQDRRRCREQRRDDLILNNPVAAQHANGGVKQEQSRRFAIPDIDIEDHPAMDHAITDEEIKFFVNEDIGHAEIATAKNEGSDTEPEPAKTKSKERQGRKKGE